MCQHHCIIPGAAPNTPHECPELDNPKVSRPQPQELERAQEEASARHARDIAALASLFDMYVGKQQHMQRNRLEMQQNIFEIDDKFAKFNVKGIMDIQRDLRVVTKSYDVLLREVTGFEKASVEQFVGVQHNVTVFDDKFEIIYFGHRCRRRCSF